MPASILDWINFACHVRISLSLFVQADIFGKGSSKDLKTRINIKVEYRNRFVFETCSLSSNEKSFIILLQCISILRFNLIAIDRLERNRILITVKIEEN